MSEGVAFVAEALAKVAVYVATLAAIGVAGARWLARLAGPAAVPDALCIDKALRHRAWLAAALILGALCLRASTHAFATFGTVDWTALRTVSLESRWGHAWQYQLGGAALLGFSAASLRDGRRWSWLLYSASALIVCTTLPLLGHAAGSGGRVVVHSIHIAAGGLWLGTLGIVLSMEPTLRRLNPLLLARWISRFASFALPGAAVLAATGAIAATLYLHDVVHLVDTAYGRRLILKLVFVVAVVVCGWFNWRQSRRGAPPRRGLIALELSCAFLTVMATGFLTESEHP